MREDAKKPILIAMIASILLLSFTIRLTSIIRYASFDLDNYPPDAAQGALTLMGMKTAFIDKFIYKKEGVAGWQFLGFKTSQANFSVPPLLLYMIFPMTFFGTNPVLFAVPFALFSWLTTLLLVVLIYKLFNNIEPTKRLLLAGLAGFWQAIFFTDVFFNSFTWSPGAIPFFFILFILLYKSELDATASMPVQILCWAIYGIILAILMSLHATALFVMPAVFIVSCIAFIIKNHQNPRKWLLPLISILTFALTLFPYLYLEIARGWLNTKEIINTMIKSTSATAHANPIMRIISNYVGLARDAYFMDQSVFGTIIAIVFLMLVTALGILKFKGNRVIFASLMAAFIVYYFAVSSYAGPDHIHNKFLILFFPMIFSISALAYSDFSKLHGKILCGFIIFGISLSFFNNIRYDYRHFYYRYSNERLMTSGDMIEILSKIPIGAVVYTPGYNYWSRREWHPFKYIDRYILKKGFTLKNFKPEEIADCQPGDYVVYPKYNFQFLSFSPLKPEFRVLKADIIQSRQLRIVYENAAAYLYVKERE